MIAFTLAENVTPSQAIDGIADLAEACILDENHIYLGFHDGEGFVQILREIARTAHANEVRLTELERAASPLCAG
jgi:hypothetical protein